jgi:hypothetical protein
MHHQRGAVRDPTAQLARSIVRLPYFGQVVASQQLRQDLGIDLICFDFGFGNSLGLRR